MIQIEHVEVMNIEGALRGMRNPMNSWNLSDTVNTGDSLNIGKDDLKLMKKLVAAGPSHRKFLRQIMVCMDITAPLYWWKEFDTYKISTVSNSCSTMHKIHYKEFTLDDFSVEHLMETSLEWFKVILGRLNIARINFVETKDKLWWWQMIQMLPTSYNQKRTITLNYETLLNMYETRKGHKLDEWNQFCDWIIQLPLTKELFT